MHKICSVDLYARICSDPEMHVFKSAGGEGKSSVTFDVVWTHVHDWRRGVESPRPQYITVRVYLKSAEAAMKYLSKGDEVYIHRGALVQDRWEKDGKKQNRYFVQPNPMGLHYIRCRNMGIGTPFEE